MPWFDRPSLSRSSAKQSASVSRLAAKLVFDCNQPVVFGDALRAAERARLDLAGAGAHGEVRYERIFSLPRAVRYDCAVARPLRRSQATRGPAPLRPIRGQLARLSAPRRTQTRRGARQSEVGSWRYRGQSIIPWHTPALSDRRGTTWPDCDRIPRRSSCCAGHARASASQSPSATVGARCNQPRTPAPTPGLGPLPAQVPPHHP